jgi:hypothetical protein
VFDPADLMRPGARRRLTEEERALAAEVFGDALDPAPVRVLALPASWPDRAFVPGRAFGRSWIVYPRAQARRDFSTGPLWSQATFVHELVHVWQAQAGVWLPWAKLRAGDGRRAYRYGLDGRPFASLNIEQQAMAVEHAFRLSRGGTAPFEAAAYQGWLPLPVLNG